MADIRLLNIEKKYFAAAPERKILAGISLDINKGNFILIHGPSGSGKTTFLMSIGGLVLPDKGSIYVNQYNLPTLSEKKRGKIRAEYFSFIFQNNILIKELTVMENILFPFQVKQKITKNTIKKALYLLDYFGLFHLTHKKVHRLSGGEQQLINFIRGVMPDTDMILADEPTSELDSDLEVKVFQYLRNINKEEQRTILLISHSRVAPGYALESYRMNRGKLTDYKRL
jgi:putative ABC transport system ATP-binding protein